MLEQLRYGDYWGRNKDILLCEKVINLGEQQGGGEDWMLVVFTNVPVPRILVAKKWYWEVQSLKGGMF
jgi:hypothetical protein